MVVGYLCFNSVDEIEALEFPRVNGFFNFFWKKVHPTYHNPCLSLAFSELSAWV